MTCNINPNYGNVASWFIFHVVGKLGLVQPPSEVITKASESCQKVAWLQKATRLPTTVSAFHVAWHMPPEMQGAKYAGWLRVLILAMVPAAIVGICHLLIPFLILCLLCLCQLTQLVKNLPSGMTQPSPWSIWPLPACLPDLCSVAGPSASTPPATAAVPLFALASVA